MRNRNRITVSIAPEDTGTAYPTLGNLVALSTEEAVITPPTRPRIGRVRLHFPRLGFVVKPVSSSSSSSNPGPGATIAVDEGRSAPLSQPDRVRDDSDSAGKGLGSRRAERAKL